jgi:hypothetical protein
MPIRRWLENRKHRKSERLASSRYWGGGKTQVFHAIEGREYHIGEGGQTTKVNPIGNHRSERVIGNVVIVAGMDEKHTDKLVGILSTGGERRGHSNTQRAKAYEYIIKKGHVNPKPGQRLVLFPIEGKKGLMPVEISAILVDKPKK